MENMDNEFPKFLNSIGYGQYIPMQKLNQGP